MAEPSIGASKPLTFHVFFGILTLCATAISVGCGGVCPTIPMEERQTFLGVKPEEGGYVVSPGDQLQIEVWQNAQLTRSVNVRPDGKITLPLVNDVQAGGKTVPQFQTLLTERLKSFLKEPIVSITVTDATDKRIYIQGQVRNSGQFTYSGEMYLLQALTMAGGPTSFAEGCAVIVRRKQDGFVRYDVQLEPLMSGADLSANVLLLPNDTVSVH